MGACTLTSITHGVEDNKRFVDATLTFSASYATDGDTIPVASLPFKNVARMYVKATSAFNDGSSVVLGGTATAPKAILYTSAATQAGSTSDNSTVAVPVRIVGH